MGGIGGGKMPQVKDDAADSINYVSLIPNQLKAYITYAPNTRSSPISLALASAASRLTTSVVLVPAAEGGRGMMGWIGWEWIGNYESIESGRGDQSGLVPGSRAMRP